MRCFLFFLLLAAAALAAAETRLQNISTRGLIGQGDLVLIGGLVIEGTSPKTILVRARGPSIAAADPNLMGLISDTTLQLVAGAVQVDFNDDWQTHDNAGSIPGPLAPTERFESAILTTLEPGAYTAIVRGFDDTTGLGIVEVFELDASGNHRLANISTRGMIGNGDDVLIGGLIVTGDEPRQIVIRAVGPSMLQAAPGLEGVLGDPTLELFAGPTAIAFNDDWQTDENAHLLPDVLTPSSTLEPILVRTLAPGAYTAIVRGYLGSTGVGLVEAYDLREVVEAGNEPPVANFSAVADLLNVSLDASNSTDADGTVDAYAWNFGDGSTSTGVTTQHSYEAAGGYDVVLTVTDDSGATDTFARRIEVNAPANAAPTARATVEPAAGVAPLAVAFDGGGSTDADGTVDQFSWSVSGGASLEGAAPNHTFTGAGEYLVTLRVTDNDGASDEASLLISVEAPRVNEPPSAVFSASTQSGTAPLTIQFDGSGSMDPDGSITAFAWDFGDGGVASGAMVSHEFQSAGNFTVELLVTDDDGLSATHTMEMSIQGPELTGKAAWGRLRISEANLHDYLMHVDLHAFDGEDSESAVIADLQTSAHNVTVSGRRFRQTYHLEGLTCTTSTPAAYDALMLFDRSESMRGNDPEDLSLDAGRLFAQNLGPDDRAEVAEFSFAFGGVRFLQPGPTNQVSSILAAIGAVESPGGGTPLWRSMLSSIDRLGTGGNRALLAFSDGADTSSDSWSEVRARAIASGVAVYAINLRNAETEIVDRIAHESGGAVFATDRVEDLLHYYGFLGRMLGGTASKCELAIRVAMDVADTGESPADWAYGPARGYSPVMSFGASTSTATGTVQAKLTLPMAIGRRIGAVDGGSSVFSTDLSREFPESGCIQSIGDYFENRCDRRIWVILCDETGAHCRSEAILTARIPRPVKGNVRFATCFDEEGTGDEYIPLMRTATEPYTFRRWQPGNQYACVNQARFFTQ